MPVQGTGIVAYQVGDLLDAGPGIEEKANRAVPEKVGKASCGV